jgi:hypothetical protein
VSAVKGLLALVGTTLTVFAAVFSSSADTDEINLYESNSYLPAYDSRFPIDFSWVVERYDFDRIEEYIDEYYGTYYKHWERYLTSKQRELAGKFGLSNIFFKPNLRCYENTKIVFTKSIWNDTLLLRYLAPVGDVRDFELFVVLRPHQAMTLIARGHIDGERSIAIVVKKSLGSESRETDLARRTKRLLGRAKRLVKRL